MRTTTRRLASAIGLIILASVLAAGCGSGGSTGGGNVGGAAAGEQLNLSGARITVGSREFTEQLILGEIALQALEKAGATVERQPAWWARMRCARRCILEVDFYWEYTQGRVAGGSFTLRLPQNPARVAHVIPHTTARGVPQRRGDARLHHRTFSGM